MLQNSFNSKKTNFLKKIILITLGIFFCLIILEIGLRLSGFVLLSIQEQRNVNSIKQKEAYRIMCLGESTTAFQYPFFLEEDLNQKNQLGKKFVVIDKGRLSVDTSFILARLESNLDEYHPDIVVTMMGINDTELPLPNREVITPKKKLFLSSLKIYKLADILWLNITAKIIGTGFYPFNRKFTRELKNIFEDKLYKEVMALPLRNDWRYIYLGLEYFTQSKFDRAEVCFIMATKLNLRNDWAYHYLILKYLYLSQYNHAEVVCKKAIKLNPKDGKAYIFLGIVYSSRGEYSQAEVCFKKAIELTPENFQGYVSMAKLYEQIGNPGLAMEYSKKLGGLVFTHIYSKPVTIDNYHKLKEILEKRGIRLVCVQYPMLSIEPLKKIFKGEKGVVFVDNEQIFKEAVKQGSYKDCFLDMFGGVFGHCTEKGNRLLAKNIADVILKEVFGKR